MCSKQLITTDDAVIMMPGIVVRQHPTSITRGGPDDIHQIGAPGYTDR